MATSSIFKDFTIEGPVEVGNFVKMLDSEPMPRPKASVKYITDPEEALRIIRQGVEYMKQLKEKERTAE